MTLSELKKILPGIKELRFELPDGKLVPLHFHITEVGQINKSFIDCGGTIRLEKIVSMQLWKAGDYEHSLSPTKLTSILNLSEKVLKIEDGEIEVEYQDQTIGKYGLDFNGTNLLLTTKYTACLANDNCRKETDIPCCTNNGEGC